MSNPMKQRETPGRETRYQTGWCMI